MEVFVVAFKLTLTGIGRSWTGKLTRLSFVEFKSFKPSILAMKVKLLINSIRIFCGGQWSCLMFLCSLMSFECWAPIEFQPAHYWPRKPSTCYLRFQRLSMRSMTVKILSNLRSPLRPSHMKIDVTAPLCWRWNEGRIFRGSLLALTCAKLFWRSGGRTTPYTIKLLWIPVQKANFVSGQRRAMFQRL